MQTIISGINLNQSLPNGQPVRLDYIEGWEQLEELQRVFLSSYFNKFPQKTAACMDVGISTNKVKQWESDETFVLVMDVIKDLHKEALSNKHYEDSYENSKIRAQVLKSMDAEGYERKESVNQRNTLVLQGQSMSDVIKALSSKPDQA